MFGIERKIAETAQKAALFSVSTALAAIGLGFLTVAAWMVMAQLQSALYAATVIGFAYLGFAGIGFAFATRSRRRPHGTHNQAHDSKNLSPMQLLAVSFVQGLEQGARARRAP